MTDDTTSTPRVDVHLTADDLRARCASDADRGLRSTPKDIPPKWFYDTRGSQLFDDITRLPEYYPTRRERAILVERAPRSPTVTRADTLVELGSGTSDKTRILLDALRDAGTITRFVPFDVSEQTLRDAADAVHRDYPSVRCTRSSATSSTISARFPAAAAGSWRSSAGRSATCCLRPGPSSCSRSRRDSDSTTTCCSASIS